MFALLGCDVVRLDVDPEVDADVTGPCWVLLVRDAVGDVAARVDDGPADERGVGVLRVHEGSISPRRDLEGTRTSPGSWLMNSDRQTGFSPFFNPFGTIDLAVQLLLTSQGEEVEGSSDGEGRQLKNHGE